VPFVGETVTHEWPLAEPAAIEAQYQTLKATAGYGTGVASIQTKNSGGRASLVLRMNIDPTGEVTQDVNDKTVVEELYAQDLIRDMAASPYFARAYDAGTEVAAWTTGGNNRSQKGLPLDSEEVAKVREACDLHYSTADITAHNVSGFQWANWSIGMKELRWAYMHGQESYLETSFILRKSSYGVRKSTVLATFTGINTVVTPPTFSTPMNDLIASLPTGEWLKKPPQAENLGKGKWRITEEWVWAEKWSIVYGGTANGID
jgi:hypothetical protein